MKKERNSLVPYVIERTSEGERSYDIFSRLLKDRIVMIQGEVDGSSMDVAVAQLLFLNNQDSEAPIYLYINSPGGEVMAGQELIDTMNFISAPVYTICLGMAASMGAAILSAGEPGHRYCMKSSQILVHPMSGGTSGRTRDNTIENNHEKRMQNYLFALIGRNCGKLSEESFQKIYSALNAMEDNTEYPTLKLDKEALKELEKFKSENDYDHWMFPKQALEFGIVDKILEKETDIND